MIRLSWIFLLIAGFAEVGSVISLKHADSFKKLFPSISCIIFGSLSFYFLSLSFTSIPVGTAYAVWTGIGSIGSVLAGMLLFNEPKDFKSSLMIVCITTGVVGIKFTS